MFNKLHEIFTYLGENTPRVDELKERTDYLTDSRANSL